MRLMAQNKEGVGRGIKLPCCSHPGLGEDKQRDFNKENTLKCLLFFRSQDRVRLIVLGYLNIRNGRVVEPT